MSTILVSGGSGAIVGGVANGSGSFSLNIPLVVGSVNTLVLTATDVAGNIGTGSIALTQDAIPLTLSLSPLSASVVNAPSLTFSGTTKANASLIVTGSASTTVTASSSGTFNITVPLIQDALNTFVVTASDLAGSTLSGSLSITEDSTAPALVVSSNSGATSLFIFTLTGSTQSGALVSAALSGTGAFTGAITSTAGSTGLFSLTVPLLANTGAVLTLTATDSAGNSSTGVIVNIIQDSLAPAIGTQSFSGVTNLGVTTGYYSFTTNEVTTSTFYVGTGSNVLTTLIWSGSTMGISHSGTIV